MQNSYYVLRDDMLEYLVSDITERLAAKQENEGWQVSHRLIFFTD